MKRTASALMLILAFLIASVVPLVAASSFFYRTYERMGIGKAFFVVQTSDGGYALVGFTQSGEDYICWLVKTDPDGNMEWNQTYGYGVANSVIQTSDGGYALAGTNLDDFCLVKTDEVGVIPEFPSWLILPLFITATLVIIINKKRLG